MFSYYGSKSKIIDYYPAPMHGKIIEPFAGSARYALKYFDRDILLVDKYEVIVNIWKYLQKCSEKDVLSFPNYKAGDRIIKEDLDCVEQYELLRFLLQQGTVGGNKAYEWGVKSYKQNLKLIASNLFKIRHWVIQHGCYKDLANELATWFVDPPYQHGGHKYNQSNKNIDYSHLTAWCKERLGQTIVCENTNANWMPFKSMVEMQGIKFRTTEAIWSNQITQYDTVQMSLL
jgi:site-specific DNA-adenine methylase